MSEATGLNPPAANPVPAGAQSEQAPPAQNLMPRFSVNDEGALGENWHQSNLIPEDLRGHGTLKKYNSIGGLVQGLVHAQQLVGADKANFLFKPGQHSSDAEKQEFYRALGVPEGAEGYEIDAGKLGLPEGMSLDDARTKDFLARAATEGRLTNDQANWVMREYAGVIAKGQQDVAAATDRMLGDAETALRSDPDWKDFEGQMGFAQKAWRAFNPAEPGSPEEDKLQMAFRGNPAAMKMLARVGKAISEDTLRGGEASTTSPSAAADMDAELQSILSDPDLKNPLSPRKAQLEKRFNEITLRKHQMGQRG